MDLVGTCPKTFWKEWLAEGDLAGEPWSGIDWGWYTRSPLRRLIKPGDRFYVVAHGKLRGYAPVAAVTSGSIIRRSSAVAVTIAEPIPGFRGLRRRWWNYKEEVPFPDWKTP